MNFFGCSSFWDLAGLLILRGWLLAATGWGILVMLRLRRRGQDLEFPIVPPPLVILTTMFLVASFLSTVWITAGLLLGNNALCSNAEPAPIGALTAWERTIFGASLIYALSCTLWIINVGLKGYRHGPKVDTGVLDAIVQGMLENPEVQPHEEIDE